MSFRLQGHAFRDLMLFTVNTHDLDAWIPDFFSAAGSMEKNPGSSCGFSLSVKNITIQSHARWCVHTIPSTHKILLVYL